MCQRPFIVGPKVTSLLTKESRELEAKTSIRMKRLYGTRDSNINKFSENIFLYFFFVLLVPFTKWRSKEYIWKNIRKAL